LNVEIPLVISNHPDLQKAVEHFDTDFHHIPTKDKAKAEQAILSLCQSNNIDFIVLARYMQIIGPELLAAYPNKVINVHHGFLPAFKGAKPYHQAYEYGVKIIGATSHYASPDLDMGPIIEQEVIRVGHTHTINDMVSLGRDVEKQVLAKAVKAHIEDRIITYKNRTVVFQ
jgi:formyltetrahydrofolate deformylase